MTTRSHSLRQRLDVVSGILLICLAMGGSMSLGLTHRQRRDATLLAVLHEQERLVYELTILGPSAEFDRGLARLLQNLRSLQQSETVVLADGTSLSLEPLRGRFVEAHLAAAIAWVESRTRAEDFMRRGSELRTYLRGLAASSESESLTTIVRASVLQLLLIACGVVFFLVGVLVVRRMLTTPLHRMADGIASMRKSGRLVKLPVMHANELGVVASGFNELAAQVEEQKNRLREHIVQLQRVNAELDRLSHLKDDFLSTVNHQVRTPLTSMLEGMSLLLDEAAGRISEDQKILLETMQHNAQQLAKLLNDILSLSTVQSGRRELHRKPEDVGTLLREANTLWTAMATTRTMRLSCPELPSVYMDKRAIGDVLDQLLHNAIRHSPERGVVEVFACQRNGLVEVSIRDHGPGIPKEALTQLFQPFTHIQTPDAPGSEGSGLGLAFCRELIERHRGSIQAGSSSEQGTTVTFTLPIASVQFVFDEACRGAQEEAEQSHTQFGVLLVTPASPQVEALLRRHTHRGDSFIRLDETSLAIVAVTDSAGLGAMMVRLDEVLDRAGLDVRMVTAVSPQDGDTSEALLRTLQCRSAEHPSTQGG
jgi:signal transduction histidine kinase